MQCYKLRKTTVGIDPEATRPVAITIPAGTVLRVPSDLANAAGFVEVEWDGKSVHIFAVDLNSRGELVKTMNATGGTR
jgi:hypothetical protein